MPHLSSITSPEDLRALDREELIDVAEQIRQFLITHVAKTGGHLGPNLGVVELTMALHRVFESPKDTLVFDTGHQSYVHKLLTGRQDFDQLRQKAGLSGYPSREESEHDVVESSHASSSLSWVDGISRARVLAGQDDRWTVGVIGDGALTGGMAWEALNNIAGDEHRKAIIVVNDNGRSYAPTVGGLAKTMDGVTAQVRKKIDQVRVSRKYVQTMRFLKEKLKHGNAFQRGTYKSLHAIKESFKDYWAAQPMFADLGLKYIGPVDGHSIEDLEDALKAARAFNGPVLVHALTQKGRGYAPAREDEADQFHTVGVIDPETGLPVKKSDAQSFTDVFGSEMLALAREREDIVAITAAMLQPVGLTAMKQEFPERVIDVGIAEQHAIASAAGLAFGGAHPVVALYSTFMNRAYDQLLMDVALHQAGVTITLDRSGVTGPDGASHHGVWDMALVQSIPGLRLAAPRDASSLREQLREAVAVQNAPSVVRFAKGAVTEELTPVRRTEDGVDVLVEPAEGQRDVLLVGIGALAPMAVEVAQRLREHGVGATVVDPRWVLPFARSIADLAAEHRLVVTLEDGIRAGGVGSRYRQEMRAVGVDTGLNEVGVPDQFLAHGTREQILADAGITVDGVVNQVLESMRGERVPRAREADAAEASTAEAEATAVDHGRRE